MNIKCSESHCWSFRHLVRRNGGPSQHRPRNQRSVVMNIDFYII